MLPEIKYLKFKKKEKKEKQIQNSQTGTLALNAVILFHFFLYCNEKLLFPYFYYKNSSMKIFQLRFEGICGWMNGFFCFSFYFV